MSYVAESPKKAHHEILAAQIDEALPELHRGAKGLLISGFAAGLEVGFSALLIAIVRSLMHGETAHWASEMATALMYSVGFIFVILGRSELFTEHTTLAALPVLDRRAGVGALARLWGLVYLSNLVGATVMAWLLSRLLERMKTVEPGTLAGLAREVTDPDWGTIVLSAVFAGWLMGLLGWLVSASRDTTSQILLIVLVTSTIGLAHLHHSIAGAVEVLAGVFSPGGPGAGDFLKFLTASTLGNAVGGVFFVAVLKIGHTRAESAEA